MRNFGKVVNSHLRKRYTYWTYKLTEAWNLKIQRVEEISAAENAYEVVKCQAESLL